MLFLFHFLTSTSGNNSLTNQHINYLIAPLHINVQVFLVLEYVNGGSLHYLLKKRANRRLSEIDARMIFSQVCAGIRYCHERLVVHRDIKLENVLVQYPDKAVAHNQNLALTSSGHLDPRQLVVKLIDFGFASLVVPGKKLRVFCGTPSYMAPEIIQRKEYGGYRNRVPRSYPYCTRLRLKSSATTAFVVVLLVRWFYLYV